MSTKRLVIRGVASTWFVQVANVALAFFITPVILRGLGVEEYGVWALCQSMLAYLAVMGFRGAGAKYFAEYDARNDAEGVARVGMASLLANGIVAILAAFIGCVLALIFPYVFNLGDVDPNHARMMVAFTGLAFGARFLGVTFRARLDGAFQITARNVIELSGAVIQSVGCLLLVQNGYGIVPLAIMVFGARALELVGFHYMSDRCVAPFRFDLKRADWEMFRKLFGFTFAQTFIGFAKRTSVYVGGILVGYFHGPAAAAYYMLGEGLLSRADSMTTPIASTLMPLSSRLEAQDRKEDLRRMLVISSRVMLLFGLIITISVLVMGDSLLLTWLGPEYVEPVHMPLVILSVAFLIRMSRKGLYSALVGMGKNYLLSKLAMLEAIVAVALGGTLTYYYGAIGMAWATVGSQVLTVSLLMPLYAKRELGLEERQFGLTVLTPALISALPSLALALLFEYYWPAQRLLVLLAEGGVVAAAGALAGFFLCIDPSMRREVLSSLMPGNKKKGKKRKLQHLDRAAAEVALIDKAVETVSRYPAYLVDRLIPPLLRGERVQRASQFLASATRADAAAKPICQSPIFVLSAGWRSGSTLLQRLVCGGPDVILWGEPYEEHGPVHRLAASIEMLDADSPHLTYMPEKLEGSLSNNWIANLNPGIQPLLEGHRAYFEGVFARPSKERGFSRWGAKYVRLSGRHAHYLKWLYPDAKIVLVIRHPLDAYRSYKRLTWWYTFRPEFRVDSARKFMAHWAYLANSFLDEAEALGAFLIRYEDLRPGHPALDRLAEYLDLQIDQSVLENKIGSRQATKFRITPFEKLACWWITRRLCCELGYASSQRPEGGASREAEAAPLASVGEPAMANRST